ncbi:MAG: UDP-N-acetylmuramoyl-tripeptide--D-alanyl-D-alanine ligase [Clostridia bacterium]|nr:UDP-N-acetylmuramoyl-tripeptide--D-alanyl-D-alanine ligase [Clostridia bacterium]
MNITLCEISQAVSGKLYGTSDKVIKAVSFDSRSCGEGVLFAALKGEKRDGHEFIPSLCTTGAAALCSQKPECDIDFILVSDVREALCSLARWYKEKKCNLKKTVALTGSVGKTTTKDMISCVLSESFSVYKTLGNYNNDIGVPMTVFGIENIHELLVCELGMNNFGEISRLTNIVYPDISVITNIGTAHIGILGSRENICKAKLEITDGMKEGSTLILNGDEPLLRDAAEELRKRYNIIFAGLDSNNDVYADNIKIGDVTEFDIHYGGGVYSAKLGVPGKHNVSNAVIAFSVGVECGMSPQTAADSLKKYSSHGVRQSITNQNGVMVYADCYNASCESMCASLNVLCSDMYGKMRKIAVLGEMRELGEKTMELHKEVGKCVARCKPDMLFTLGNVAKEIEKSAVENGFSSDNCFNYDDREEFVSALKNTVRSGDIVLFKASLLVNFKEIISKLGFETQ